MKLYYIIILLAGLALGGIAVECVTTTHKWNSDGISSDSDRVTRLKVHFNTTKFPELPKWAYAKSVKHFSGSTQSRWGEIEIVLEDGRKITTTYSNIAVEG